MDFNEITISNGCLQALCKMPRFPWLIVSLVVDNYQTAEPVTAVMGKGIADNWCANTITEIVRDEELELSEVETAACSLIDTYSKKLLIKHVSMETGLLHKVRCRLASKIGAVLRDKKKRKQWRTELSNLECAARKKLLPFVDGLLPERVLEVVKPPEVKAASSQLVEVDEAPALTFDETGTLLHDFADKAREKGFAVGTLCAAARVCQGITKDRPGTVVRFGANTVDVRFDKLDDLEEATHSFPLGSLKVRTAAPQLKRQKKHIDDADMKAMEALGKTVEGIEWQPFDDHTIAAQMMNFMLTLNEQLADFGQGMTIDRGSQDDIILMGPHRPDRS